MTPVLLTGDHERAAGILPESWASAPSRRSACPEDKLTWIDRSQQSGHLVCMVGDGINDAPALKRAMWALPWAAWAATSLWTPRTSPW